MNIYWPTITITFTNPPADTAYELMTAFFGLINNFEGTDEEHEDPLNPSSPLTVLNVYLKQLKGEESAIVEEAKAAKPQVENALRRAKEMLPSMEWSIECRAVESVNWGEKWRDYFHLTKVGERLYCAPPWEADLPADAPEGATVVLIEPGQAFGTGTHETSKLCMGLLESYVPRDGYVFDVGAGSGILSITAVKLGAKGAICLEIDDVAEENFLENVSINHVENQLFFILGESPRQAMENHPQKPSIQLILCNMLTTEFIPLLSELREFDQPMILSGYLVSDHDEVHSALRKTGWEVTDERSENEWSACLARPIQGDIDATK